MKIKLTWEEFVEAADVGLRAKGHLVNGFPEFFNAGSYEPDTKAYNFPPDYVEVEVESPNTGLE